MKVALVVNPRATRVSVGSLDRICDELRPHVELTVARTESAGHAWQIAAELGDVEAVLVYGGDGTVNEVVNGLLDAHRQTPAADRLPVVGILPGGYANVVARELGSSGDPVTDAPRLLTAVHDRRARRLSLGKANDRWFLMCAGTGLDAEVIAAGERVRQSGRTLNAARYLSIALREYASMLGDLPAFEVEIDGEVRSRRARLVVSQNFAPLTYLAGRRVDADPEAAFGRGLSTWILESLAPHVVAYHTVRIFSGGRLPGGLAGELVGKATRIRISSPRPHSWQLDGEAMPATNELTIEFQPDAIDFLDLRPSASETEPERAVGLQARR